MASFIDYFTEGSRIALTQLKNRILSKKYKGDAEAICKEIVHDCWNGQYFRTSTNNFPQFWTRDFGWCTASLMRLKYEEAVHHTLRYALNRFRQYNKIATTITPSGKPFDYPYMAVDSLPWLVHSLKVSKFPYYAYKNFLNKEILRFYEEIIDPVTGLVRAEKEFSSIKDFAVRKSSCYDNCMVALLSKDLKSLKGVINPFARFDYPTLILHHFWNGEYFFDDLTKQEYLAADANIFPFILGIITNEGMLRSVIAKIREAELDLPFPLKYTSGRGGIKFIPQEIFMRGYESNAAWTHMGPLYIKLVKQVDPALASIYQNQYKELIEKHKNYLEVFSPDGTPFSTPFYYCDSGMLWAANYLTL